MIHTPYNTLIKLGWDPSLLKQKGLSQSTEAFFIFTYKTYLVTTKRFVAL